MSEKEKETEEKRREEKRRRREESSTKQEKKLQSRREDIQICLLKIRLYPRKSWAYRTIYTICMLNNFWNDSS